MQVEALPYRTTPNVPTPSMQFHKNPFHASNPNCLHTILEKCDIVREHSYNTTKPTALPPTKKLRKKKRMSKKPYAKQTDRVYFFQLQKNTIHPRTIKVRLRKTENKN